MEILFLIITGIIILLIFSYRSNHRSDGEMRMKYSVLIQSFLSGHERSQIFKENSNSILLGVSHFAGSTLFTIIQYPGIVQIHWAVNSSAYGKHSLKWEFPDYMDQNVILLKINLDVNEYHRKNLILP